MNGGARLRAHSNIFRILLLRDPHDSVSAEDLGIDKTIGHL